MKNFFKNKNMLIGVLLAIVFVMAIGFAGFAQNLQISDTASSTNTWNIYISNAELASNSPKETGSVTKTGGLEATFATTLHSPGDTVVYNVTVTNEGSVDATLDELNLNTTNSDSVIKYSSSGIAKGDTLAQSESKTFTVTVEYDSTKTGTATEAQKSNSATLQLNFVQKTSSGTVTPPQTITTSDLKNSVVTSGDGLYADTYEEGRYVYKGAAPANYITFNGEEAGWRIISVEADGTLKIIRNSSIGAYNWNENGTNTWSSATLNTYLNGTYKGTLSDTSDIQTHDFPVGAAVNKNNDLAAQITAEKATTWNGDIGLMSLSDYLRANTNTASCGNYSLNNTNGSTCATTNWIAVALKSSNPWTMTAASGSSNLAFHVNSVGYLVNLAVISSTIGVAPVLYLKSDITLTGSGSSEDPFEIKG